MLKPLIEYQTDVSRLQIEYNGETLSLDSPADLAEWLNERKRFFPTKQRVEEKKSEVQTRMDERRRIELETRAAAAAADPAGAMSARHGTGTCTTTTSLPTV